jgi:hypothetical protein
MKETDSPNMAEELQNMPREQKLSMLFVQMVMQTAEMALMFLSKEPHPQTGESVYNIDAARLFIDQLEALEEKTKGNLDPQEQLMLKQSLMQTRMAFVQAVENPPQETSKTPEPAPASAASAASGGDAAETKPEEEPHKRFSKKF